MPYTKFDVPLPMYVVQVLQEAGVSSLTFMNESPSCDVTVTYPGIRRKGQTGLTGCLISRTQALVSTGRLVSLRFCFSSSSLSTPTLRGIEGLLGVSMSQFELTPDIILAQR